MPLNKFIPLSPDPNITRDSDMGMAQFGHLNTIVDYLNTYVAADSLQLDGTGPLSTTLRAVTDAAGNLSPLKISTTAVQIVSPLRITTDDPSDFYLDCEDGSTNNRFSITRATTSQQVNLNFASNPGGSTSMVGAIRTYVDGVNLSEVMQFREDGDIFGGGTPSASNFIIQKEPTNDLIIYSPSTLGGILTIPSTGNANTMLNGILTGTHGGYGNVAVGLGTIQADGSAYNFNVAMGQASFVRGRFSTAIGQGATIGSVSTTGDFATAIGYNAVANGSNCFALGDSTAKLQIGGNFVPTARVHIKGLGSTAATVALLVQNSSSNNSLQIYDNFNVVFGSTFLRTLTIRPEDASGVYGNSCSIRGGAGNGRLDFFSAANITSLTDNAVFVGSSGNDMQFGTVGITATVSTGNFVINSTTQGFLKPRMTTTQKNAIVTPAAGLEVFDTTLGRPCFYSGSAWVTL